MFSFVVNTEKCPSPFFLTQLHLSRMSGIPLKASKTVISVLNWGLKDAATRPRCTRMNERGAIYGKSCISMQMPQSLIFTMASP